MTDFDRNVPRGLEVLKTLDLKTPLKFKHFQMGTITLISPDASIEVHIQSSENTSKITEGMTLGDLVRADNLYYYGDESRGSAKHFFGVIESPSAKYSEVDFLGRLNLEKEELRHNRSLLEKFINSEAFETLNSAQKQLLKMQGQKQSDLLKILDLRFESLSNAVNSTKIDLPITDKVSEIEKLIDKLLETKQRYDFVFMGSEKFHNELEPLRIQIELIKHKLLNDPEKLK